MKLSRTDAILKCIVDYFIKNAQPLGSQTLIDEYRLPYSSATIRNEMLALEKMGYIEKTHSSSGRVPSAKGYKYYCEKLREKNVDERLKFAIQTILEEKSQSIEETIKESCEILSHMTSLVSVFLGPDANKEKLANIQLIKVGDNTLTAIFVTDSGYVENKTFLVTEKMNADDIVNCVKLLNDRLVGTPVIELVDKMKALEPVLNDYIVNHDVVYQALLQTFVKFANDRLSLYGQEELFSQPEFTNDVQKLKQMMKVINDKTLLKELEDDEDDISVSIGEVEGNPDVSMVSTKVQIGDSSSTIALVGPMRMDYEKVVSALEYIADALNEYFKKEGK